jgi:hypothetical protein
VDRHVSTTSGSCAASPALNVDAVDPLLVEERNAVHGTGDVGEAVDVRNVLAELSDKDGKVRHARRAGVLVSQ